MERITPLDLEGAQLPKAKKGYEMETVDALLRAAAGEIESLLKSNHELLRFNSEDKRELESFRLRESTLSSALLLAQRTADETRATAHKQAEVIIQAANQQAKEIRSKSNEEIVLLERRIEHLQRDKENFEYRFSNMLHEYLSGLSFSDTIRLEEDRAA